MRCALVALSVLALAACGPSSARTAPDSTARGDVGDRVRAIAAAVDAWQEAADLPAARAAAEEARNLVLGPAGPGYGDSDGDGTVRGATDVGLLPGKHGEPSLTDDEALSECLDADVRGGSWTDPAARWGAAADAVAGWSEADNTFPALASHPQRVYGWASLAIISGSLADARGFAGHAQLHVEVTRDALDRC